jgi:hypothetical protein
MSQLIEPKKKIQLYKALKIGYTRDQNKQQKALKKYGYVLDRDLTNPREHVVAYNPLSKKLLYISQGTDPHSAKDIQTDLVLATGGFKHTQRYESERNALLKAQKKYGTPASNVYLAGHSLGGQVVNAIAPSGSHAYTYNAAFAPGQKAREAVHNYRTAGDAVSILAPKANTTTLGNAVAPGSSNLSNYLLKAHQLENLRNMNIYV